MRDRDEIQNVFSAFELPQNSIQEVLHMKKIDEITKTTGLSRNQIGLYIRENLIHPAQSARKHFEIGILTESELQQLRAVQALRIHDFGLEEIKYLTVCGEASSEYLETKSEKKLVLYRNMEDVLSAVAALQANAPEGKELEKLRKEIRHYDYLPKDPNAKPSFLQKHFSAIALSVILAILLLTLFARLYRPASKILAVLAFVGVGAMIALGSGIVYLVKRKPPKAYSCKGTAVIEKVDRVTEFDTSFAIGKSIVPGSGFREQGQGGVWQFVFMFWNEIRPDHYFPIVRFSHNGQERIATFRFGAFRHSLKAGDTIPVYWSEADDGIVYPENTSFMVQKSICALCIAFLLGGIFCMEIGPVSRAANHEFTVYNMREILFGMEGDTFEGTEEISDSEILLEFTHFTGSRNMTIACQKGDVIYLETDSAAEGLDIRFRAEMKTELGILRPDQHLGDALSSSRAVYAIAKDGVYKLNVSAYQAAGRIHAIVYHGADMANMAGNALNALADSQSLVLKSTFLEEKEKPAETTTTLYYDHGRYYQRTEEKSGDSILIREALFDGNTGWVRTQTPDAAQPTDWTQSTDVSSEPELIAFLRAEAAKLTGESEIYKGISYLEGSFLCSMTDEYLERLSADAGSVTYTLGSLLTKIDESSGKATFFRQVLIFTEEQNEKSVSGDTTFSVEVLQDIDPSAEIEKYLGER